MTRRQIRKRLTKIVSDNFEEASLNPKSDSSRFAARFPTNPDRMRSIHKDIAFLGKVLMALERRNKLVNLSVDTEEAD